MQQFASCATARALHLGRLRRSRSGGASPGRNQSRAKHMRVAGAVGESAALQRVGMKCRHTAEPGPERAMRRTLRRLRARKGEGPSARGARGQRTSTRPPTRSRRLRRADPTRHGTERRSAPRAKARELGRLSLPAEARAISRHSARGAQPCIEGTCRTERTLATPHPSNIACHDVEGERDAAVVQDGAAGAPLCADVPCHANPLLC